MSVCKDYSAPFPPVSHGACLHTLFFNVLGIYSSECSLSVTIFFCFNPLSKDIFLRLFGSLVSLSLAPHPIGIGMQVEKEYETPQNLPFPPSLMTQLPSHSALHSLLNEDNIWNNIFIQVIHHSFCSCYS